MSQTRIGSVTNTASRIYQAIANAADRAAFATAQANNQVKSVLAVTGPTGTRYFEITSNGSTISSFTEITSLFGNPPVFRGRQK